jgi:hypothetical protein
LSSGLIRPKVFGSLSDDTYRFFADIRRITEQLTAVKRWYWILGHALIKYLRNSDLRQPLWRIWPDVKVVPVPPPVRKINSKGTAVLKARRAGNRGKSKSRLKTTPVFG